MLVVDVVTHWVDFSLWLQLKKQLDLVSYACLY